MKIIKCTYEGISDPFTRLRLQVEENGVTREVILYVENDGRDAMLETPDGLQIDVDWEKMFTPENYAKLLPALEQGGKDWEKLQEHEGEREE